MPPCMSFELRLLVPDAQSRASSMPTRRPRVTASRAAPGADDAAADHQHVEFLLAHVAQCRLALGRAELVRNG